MIKSAKLDLSWAGFLTPLRTPLGAVMRWVTPVCVCLYSLSYELHFWFPGTSSQYLGQDPVWRSRSQEQKVKRTQLNTHICRWSAFKWQAVLLCTDFSSCHVCRNISGRTIGVVHNSVIAETQQVLWKPYRIDVMVYWHMNSSLVI